MAESPLTGAEGARSESNLVVSADGTVKIADFGIALIANEAAASLTTTGQVIGTTTYLAPERAPGRPAVPASDVYSLGCVLYELLAGQPPFRADSMAATIYQHVDALPTPLGRLRPEIPGALDDYLMRLLAKDPDRRPTAEEVADWFADPVWLGTQRLPAAPSVSMNKTARLATAPSRPPRPTARRTGRAKVLAGIVGAAAVGTASVFVGMSIGGADSDSPARQATQSSATPSHSASAEPSETPSPADTASYAGVTPIETVTTDPAPTPTVLQSSTAPAGPAKKAAEKGKKAAGR